MDQDVELNIFTKNIDSHYRSMGCIKCKQEFNVLYIWIHEIQYLIEMRLEYYTNKIWALHLDIFIPYILLLNEARFLFLFTNQMYKHLRTHIYIYLILFRSLLKPNVKPILFFLLFLFPMFGVVVFVIYPYSHMS